MKLSTIAAAIPGIQKNIVLPTKLVTYPNLIDSVDGIQEIANTIDWRRNYINPVGNLLALASDSGASEEYKKKSETFVHRYHELLHNLYLPVMHANGNRFNDDYEDINSYYGHNIADFLEPYALLFDTTGVTKELISNHARWLVWDQENGTKGFIKQPDQQFYHRAFLRRLFHLIMMSESQTLDLDTRDILSREAQKSIQWMLNSEADGTLDSLGWSAKYQAMYFDHDTSVAFNGRVLHAYFLAITHDILIRIPHTVFYAKNRALVERWKDQVITTTKTLIDTSEHAYSADGQKETPSLFNIREEEWAFDRLASGKHLVWSTNSSEEISSPPFRFWLMYNSVDELQTLLKESSVTWVPNIQYYPEFIVAFNTIISEIPDNPELRLDSNSSSANGVNSEIIASIQKIDLAIKTARVHLSTASKDLDDLVKKLQ